MLAYLSGLRAPSQKRRRLTKCHKNPNSFRTRGKSREGAREEGSPQGFRAGGQKIVVAVRSSREGFGVSLTTS